MDWYVPVSILGFPLAGLFIWALLKMAGRPTPTPEEVDETLEGAGPPGWAPRKASPASRPTTTPTSPAGPLDVGYEASVRIALHYLEQVSMSPGSPGSHSHQTILDSLRLLGHSPEDMLSHVALCSTCQGQPGALLSLCKMLVRAVLVLGESTSPSAATSSSAAPEPGPVPYGSSLLINGARRIPHIKDNRRPRV